MQRCDNCSARIAADDWTRECKSCSSDVCKRCIDGVDGRLCKECWPDFHSEPFVSEEEMEEVEN